MQAGSNPGAAGFEARYKNTTDSFFLFGEIPHLFHVSSRLAVAIHFGRRQGIRADMICRAGALSFFKFDKDDALLKTLHAFYKELDESK